MTVVLVPKAQGVGVSAWKSECRSHCYLLASFIPAVVFAFLRYDLWLLPTTLARLDFESLGAVGHMRSSDLSFGIDYLFHLVTTFIILHNILVFLSARYRRSPRAAAILVLLISAPCFWVLDIFLPPHGVLAEYLDDVLIYPAVIVAFANVATACFANRADKIVQLVAGFAMVALLAENALCHAALSGPSEAFLSKQREWMARTVDQPVTDIVKLCEDNGYVCVVRGKDGREVALAADAGRRLESAVVANIVEAARKYAVLDANLAYGIPFDIRHGALTTKMGIMRYTAFKVRSNENIVAIDAVASSEAMLWFHTLFGVHVTIIGFLLIIVIAFSLRFARISGNPS